MRKTHFCMFRIRIHRSCFNMSVQNQENDRSCINMSVQNQESDRSCINMSVQNQESDRSCIYICVLGMLGFYDFSIIN
jgi:hypothetical protein